MCRADAGSRSVRPGETGRHVLDDLWWTADRDRRRHLARQAGTCHVLQGRWLPDRSLEPDRACLRPVREPAGNPVMSYLNSRDRRRSASGLPPVWQVGQYCSAESANDTSLIVSPQTGHGCPARPCTRRPVFFSAFRSPAAWPADRPTAPRRVATMAACSVATSSGVNPAASLNGDIFAACSTSSE